MNENAIECIYQNAKKKRVLIIERHIQKNLEMIKTKQKTRQK